MSVLFDSQAPYGDSSAPYDPYGQGQPFYQSSGAPTDGSGYYATGHATPGLEGNMNVGGGSAGVGGFGVGGHMVPQGGFWSAFGTGGFPDEPPLLEELGINFEHIQHKSLAVLNPLHSYSGTVDMRMMDDADLAGPLIFCFAFAMFLLFSGKPQFGYIYGVALLGCLSIYTLLNMMSEQGIDVYRVASVLGYCLLPLVLLSLASVVMRLDGLLGYIISPLTILWCSYAASGIFVSVLQMSEQRLLVAYPVGLFYACFAILSVFDVGSGRVGAR